MLLKWRIQSLVLCSFAYFSKVMNSSMGKCEHTNIFKDLLMPIRVQKHLMYLSKSWEFMWMRFLFKIIAFIGGVKPADVLLPKNLKIMKNNYHSYLNLSLLIIEEKHKIDLHSLNRISKSGSVFCFTLELFFWFYSSDRSKNIDNSTMFFIKYLIYSYKFSCNWAKAICSLRDNRWIAIKGYLKLFLFECYFDLSRWKEVAITYN